VTEPFGSNRTLLTDIPFVAVPATAGAVSVAVPEVLPDSASTALPPPALDTVQVGVPQVVPPPPPEAAHAEPFHIRNTADVTLKYVPPACGVGEISTSR